MMRYAGTGIAMVALLALAGCGSSDSAGSDDTAGDTSQVKTVEVTVTDAGCEPATLAAVAGPTTFHVSNEGTGDATEFEVIQGSTIFGELENIEPGKDSSLSLTLQPGTYVTKCRGGTTDTGALEVTGTGTATAVADPAASAAAVTAYLAYVTDESEQLITAVQPFVDAVKAGDVETAKSLFAAARYHYESIEPIAESFGDLDPDIDAREGDVPDDQWGGFHRIEKALWVDNTTDGMAPVADKLMHRRRRSARQDRHHRTRAGPDRQRCSSSCSTRCRHRRSPVKRTATPTPTCRTSPPTSPVLRRRSRPCVRC